VTRDAYPDGKEFVRTGIIPEHRVEVEVADVLADVTRCWSGRAPIS